MVAKHRYAEAQDGLGRDYARYRQTCKVCGRPDKFNFSVSDEQWSRIVPTQYRTLVVCFACFDLFAHAVGEKYALVGPVYFVGDQGVFEFKPCQL